MSRAPPQPPARSTYRHGDLRRALLEAGLALAREGGPDAVGLREVTRRAGVVPNAAYRHFGSHAEFLQAVRSEALAAVARSMEHELDAVPPLKPGTRANSAAALTHARARLRAVGMGYLRYAWKEPGLFRIAFLRPHEPQDALPEREADPAKAGRSGLNPFQLLGSALDDLVKAGALPAERRPHAEYVAWSAVHGLALLVTDGPLHGASRQQAEGLGMKLLEMVERGI
ncbi:TetR/AcrR family transcriptional regulator [Ramlibacter sp. G-1-2-2]|uniref:TetR/AcrR family transcriptional regulator n=1 Tax=Ramlibacter agri TaxID=2728837 RepID=A0A848H022_9BURK|nr:TetR/AcrR family transcriptional regulator [Ramlibacter agri]NML44306.1 TetR/AcrR family transcriptional regulator [Ramlibacter agri]